jgi:DNA-binding CsgD family transcriptional regulator
MEASHSRFDDGLAIIDNVAKTDDQLPALIALKELYGVANLAYHVWRVEGSGESDLPLMGTCNPEMITRYIAREYATIDPILKASLQADLPIEWLTLDRSSSGAKRYFAELHRFEIGRNGMSVPIHTAHGDAVFSFTSQTEDEQKWFTFRRKIKPEMALLARYFHDKAISLIKGRSALPYLSRQERRCLQLYSEGHNAQTISGMLGLSVHTVRMHLSNAQKRLGVQSRAEAVAKALGQGLIRLKKGAAALLMLELAWFGPFQFDISISLI